MTNMFKTACFSLFAMLFVNRATSWLSGATSTIALQMKHPIFPSDDERNISFKQSLAMFDSQLSNALMVSVTMVSSYRRSERKYAFSLSPNAL
ncbi:hypothetical protein Z950_587 [Sulfitobacter mediterraneus KCTC 32188]|nr:hypothetical protein Z950_587 [Sulfitobacter mediterraneus KCTC 32188]